MDPCSSLLQSEVSLGARNACLSVALHVWAFQRQEHVPINLTASVGVICFPGQAAGPASASKPARVNEAFLQGLAEKMSVAKDVSGREVEAPINISPRCTRDVYMYRVVFWSQAEILDGVKDDGSH